MLQIWMKKVGMNGTYDHLLQMIETVVEKGTYQEFAFLFFLRQHKKQRVKEHIADYGEIISEDLMIVING